ncbi:hypothetical protein ACQSED_27390 [Salmonella enterica]|uniref:hypothetical protein n=1 Tax=Salmonella enterica TaxID=28901 RepID=UPI003D31DD06
MTKTLNPTITVTVSGPTGSGKSRVLAVIADVLKLIHSDCIIEAPDVKAEKEMCGDDHAAWHKPRNGTIFKLEEVNLPIRTGRCVAVPAVAAITTDDLCDRPVPVHIQGLMSMLGISFEEYKETSLQPVVDLVNWALTTPPVPEQKIQTDKKGNEYSSRNPNCLSGVTNKDGQNAPQLTSLTPEDTIRQVTEPVIAILDCHKRQQIHSEELIEKIRKEILNLHNRLG